MRLPEALEVLGPLRDRAVVVARLRLALRAILVRQAGIDRLLPHLPDRRRDEEDLAAALELALDGLLDRDVLHARDERAHRATIGRGRGDDREVAQVRHREVQRARDRGGGQGEHVDLGAGLLDPLLVRHAEPLLLVDHEEAEVLEPHVGRERAVGADDDIDAALGDLLDGRDLLALGLEPAELPEVHGEAGEPLAHRAEVLLDEHGGGREHARLLSALHGTEHGAHRDLGLAVPDVTADQAIHRARRLHIGEHGIDRGRLIGRLVERERGFELAEAVVGGRERVAGQGGALRVELQQLLGERADVALDLAGRDLPRLPAELVELRAVALGAHVALHLAEPIDREVERAAVVLELQRLDVRGADHREALEPVVPPHAVALVDEVVAGGELREIGDAPEERVLRSLLRLAVVRALAEHVGREHERDAIAGAREAVGGRTGEDRDPIALAGLLVRLREAHVDAAVREHAEQAIDAALRIAGEHDPQAIAAPPVDGGGERGHVLGIAERARVLELLREHVQVIGIDAHLRARLVVQLEDRQLHPARRGEGHVGGHEVRGRRIAELAVLRARLGHPLREPDLRIGPDVRDGAAARIGIEHDPPRVRGEVAADRHELVVERGGKALDAHEHPPGLDLLDHLPRGLRGERDLVRVVAEPLPHVARAGGDGLAHRVQVDHVDRAQRALALRIEHAERFHLVAEQLDAHRVRRERREHVDEAAAHGERARLVHHGRARPSPRDEERGELVAIDRVLRPDRPAARRQLRCGQRLADDRLGGRDHEPRPQRGLGDAVQRGHPVHDARAVGREIGVRRDVDPRQHRDVVDAPEREVLGQRAGRRIVGRDHDQHRLARHELRGEPGRPAGRRAEDDDVLAVQRGFEPRPHRRAP